ncbi:maleylpyruvate isomerase family mycothiol-dependent enzyme [Actinacidiphila sp. bgisy145]|uniref:maleylpyruvate isomerase family mycothiol-dependent enzyme n=1 Tax=Actinacidiphila sp. bgisy145 TaxID=3413792 RepID=UPI003EBEF982
MTPFHIPPAGDFPVLRFSDWLELVADRSAALRKAAEAADARARVPGCPDWTVHDLVAHVGQVQRFWAAAVTAGPATRPPDPHPDPTTDPSSDPASAKDGALLPPGELSAWSARATAALLDALRAAGPDRECWTWWAAPGRPATAGTVARHQVQEAAVHARDAQDAAGAPEPLPPALALDAVDELLQVGFGTMDGWPHAPARVALVSTEGPAWTLILDATGASAVRVGPGDGPAPDACLTGSAGELLLCLYRRVPWNSGTLRVSGDPAPVRQLAVWSPLD